jgi:hypothetical protein
VAEIHNELRYGLELLEQYSKYLGLERGAGVERLGETLTPVLDMWRLPELAALRREALWWVTVGQVAVALQRGIIGITNLAGSNLLITVDGYASSDANVGIGSVAQALAIGIVAFAADARDRRFGSSQSVTGVKAFAGTSAAPGATVSWDRIIVNTIIPIQAVLQPGSNLSIVHNVANTAFNAAFFGRVRRATDQELKVTGSV